MILISAGSISLDSTFKRYCIFVKKLLTYHWIQENENDGVPQCSRFSQIQREHSHVHRNALEQKHDIVYGWQFSKKKISAEDGIDATNGYFRRNSDSSMAQKTLGIPFRTIPRKKIMLGIPYSGTEIESNSILCSGTEN